MATQTRRFELTARFKATADTKGIDKFEKRLEALEARIKRMDKDITLNVDVRGDRKANSSLKGTEEKLDDVSKKSKIDVEVRENKRAANLMAKRLDLYEKKFDAISNRVIEAELTVDDKEGQKNLQRMERALNNLVNRTWNMKIEAEGRNFDTVAEEAEKLEGAIDELNGRVATIRARLEGHREVKDQLDKLQRIVTVVDNHDATIDVGANTRDAIEKITAANAYVRRQLAKAHEIVIQARLEGNQEVVQQAEAVRDRLAATFKNAQEIKLHLQNRELVERGVARVQRDLQELTSRPWEIELQGDITHAVGRFKEAERIARQTAARAYQIEIRAEAEGFPEVAAQARALRQQLTILSQQRANMVVKLQGVPEAIRGLFTVKRAAEGVEGEYEIRLDTSRITSALNPIRAVGAAFTGFMGHVTRAAPLFETIARKAYLIQQNLYLLRTAILAVGIAAAGPLVAGLQAVVFSLASAATGFGLLLGVAAPIISAFSNQAENARKAKTANDQLATASSNLASAQQGVDDALRGTADAAADGAESIKAAYRGVEDAQQTLVDAAAEGAENISAAYRGVEDAKQALVDTARDGAESIKSAYRGVEDANQALVDTTRDGAESIKAAYRAVQDAEQALVDATLDGAESIKAAHRGVADAQQAIADAARDGAEDIQNAYRGVQDAQQAVVDAARNGEEQITSALEAHAEAVRDVEQAVEELRDAELEYVDALRDEEDQLNQMSRDIEGMRLDQRDNTLDLVEAQRELNEAMAGGNSEEIARAQLALERAQLRQRNLAYEIRQAEEELQEARVNGTDRLQGSWESLKGAQDSLTESVRNEQKAQVDVQKAREEAARAQADAQRGLMDANAALAKAQQDSARAQAEAQQGLRDANTALAKAQQDAARAQVDAQRDVMDANEALVKAQQDAARAQVDAQRDVMDANAALAKARDEDARAQVAAQRNVMDANAAVAKAQKDAARAQVDAQQGLMDANAALVKAQQDAARSQEDANRSLVQAQQELIKAQQEHATALGAVGGLADAMPPRLVKIQEAAQALWEEWKRGTEPARNVMLELMEITLRLGSIALPTLIRSANETAAQMKLAFQDIAAGWAESGVLDSLQDIFRELPVITGNWTRAIGYAAGALLNLWSQTLPFAKDFSFYIADVAKRFMEWTNSEAGRAAIRDFLKSAVPVARALRDVIREVGGAIIGWSVAHPEKVAAAIRGIGWVLITVVKTIQWVIDLFQYMNDRTDGWFGPIIFKLGLIYLGFLLIPRPIRIIIALIGRMAVAALNARLAAAGLGRGFLGVMRLIMGGSAAAGLAIIRGIGGGSVRAGMLIQRLGMWILRLRPLSTTTGFAVRNALAGAINQAAIRGSVALINLGRVMRGLSPIARTTGFNIRAALARGFIINPIIRFVNLFRVHMFQLPRIALQTTGGIRVAFLRVFGTLPGFVQRMLARVGLAFRLLGRGVGLIFSGIGRAISGIGGSIIKAISWITGLRVSTVTSAGTMLKTFLRVFGLIAIAAELVIRGLIEIFGSLVPMFRGLGTQLEREGAASGSAWLEGFRAIWAAGAMVILKTAYSLADGIISIVGNALKIFGVDTQAKIDEFHEKSRIGIENWRNRLYGETNIAAMEIGNNMARGADAMNRETLRGAEAAKTNVAGARSGVNAELDALAAEFDADFGRGTNAALFHTDRLMTEAGADMSATAFQGGNAAMQWNQGVASNMWMGSNSGADSARYLHNVSDAEMQMMSTQTGLSMAEVRNIIEIQSGSAADNGGASFQRLQNVSDAEMQMMAEQTGLSMSEVRNIIEVQSGTAEQTGNSNFSTLRSGATTSLDDLKTNVSESADRAQQNISGSTLKAQEEGIRAMITLQQKGGDALFQAQVRWSDIAWSTAGDIQNSLNAIISGVGEFIEAVGIDMNKPSTFRPYTSSSAGTGGGTGGGGEAARVGGNARGNVHKFAGGGIAPIKHARGGQGPEGGIAEGTTRVYGEVPGTTEFYITDNKRYRDRNLEILSRANEHMIGAEGTTKMARGDERNASMPSVVMERLRSRTPEPSHKPYEIPFAAGGIASADAMARQVYEKFGVVGENYHYNYLPADVAARSVDFRVTPNWGDYATGGDKTRGDNIAAFVSPPSTEYAIWYAMGNFGGGWGPWSGQYGSGNANTMAHYDHVHATALTGEFVGGQGGGPGKPAIDFEKEFKKYIPETPDFGPTKWHGMAEKTVEKMRNEVKKLLEPLTASIGAWNGGGDLDEWITKGIDLGGVFRDDPSTHAAIKSRAMQESGGDPNAVNNWDSNAAAGIPSKGLMQIIEPTWMANTTEQIGNFVDNWMNPIKSVATATRYMKSVYGGPVGATGVGYSHGGIATGPQMGLVGDTGPEMMVPLDDPRAVRQVQKAVDNTTRVRGGGGGDRCQCPDESNPVVENNSRVTEENTAAIDASVASDEQVAESNKIVMDSNGEVVEANEATATGLREAINTFHSGIMDFVGSILGNRESNTSLGETIRNLQAALMGQQTTEGTNIQTAVNRQHSTETTPPPAEADKTTQEITKLRTDTNRGLSANRQGQENTRKTLNESQNKNAAQITNTTKAVGGHTRTAVDTTKNTLSGRIQAVQNAVAQYVLKVQQSVDALLPAINESAENTANLGADVLSTALTTDALLATTRHVWGLAEGAIVRRPTRAVVGEGGNPEAVIPINERPRSRHLLEETARMMGYNLVSDNPMGTSIFVPDKTGFGTSQNTGSGNPPIGASAVRGQVATYDPTATSNPKAIAHGVNMWNSLGGAMKILPHYGTNPTISIVERPLPEPVDGQVTFPSSLMEMDPEALNDPSQSGRLSVHEWGHAIGFGHQEGHYNSSVMVGMSGPNAIVQPTAGDAARYHSVWGHGAVPKPFAQGGVVTEPTLALIGEEGPEAVVPLRNEVSTNRSTAGAISNGRSQTANNGITVTDSDASSGTDVTPVVDAIDDLKEELKTTLVSELKEIDLGQRTLESMFAAGFKTALAAIKSNAGKQAIDSAIGDTLDFDRMMRGLK